MGGYVNRLAYIDLTSRAVTTRTLSSRERRLWIGGSGLGAKILSEESPAGVDPLGPDNPLIFMTGPMTGTCIPGSGRHQVVTKSPLTGIYGEADAGGSWGTMLKRAGFDGLVIKGQASSPVYLFVHDGQVEILDADVIWGLDTYETDSRLKKMHGPDIAVACVGPAGERKVLLATIINEGRNARASGRGGLGAAMGAKRVKAVVAAGDGEVTVADGRLLAEKIAAVLPTLDRRTKSMQTYGTAGGLYGAESLGDLPVKNWSGGSWPEVDKVSGQTMAESMVIGRQKCHACPVACGRMIKAESRFGKVEGAGPEYETLGMFGGSCMVSDLAAIAHANEMCNRYGLDTISVGAVIAFVMELYENKLVAAEELDDGTDLPVVPQWGDANAMIRLIDAIGCQAGIGRVLGQGVKRAAQYFGDRAADFALHVKGLELPAHDPRAFNSLGLGYATSNRGACHLQGGSYFFEKMATLPEVGITTVLDRFRTDNQGEVQARLQDVMCLMDSLKLCKFLFYGGITLTVITDWFNALIGGDYTVKELLKAGERIFTLKRAYNVRCGVTRADDSLPRRILQEPRPDGGAAGNLPPLKTMLDEYYLARGWDEEGRPLTATLVRLGLDKSCN